MLDNVKGRKSKSEYIKTPTYYYAPGKNGKVIVTGSDIYQIAKIINNVIFDHFPSLDKLYSYFTEMVRAISKLELPVSWMTPTGIIVIQHYTLSESHKVSLSFKNRKKSVIILEKKLKNGKFIIFSN